MTKCSRFPHQNLHKPTYSKTTFIYIKKNISQHKTINFKKKLIKISVSKRIPTYQHIKLSLFQPYFFLFFFNNNVARSRQFPHISVKVLAENAGKVSFGFVQRLCSQALSAIFIQNWILPISQFAYMTDHNELSFTFANMHVRMSTSVPINYDCPFAYLLTALLHYLFG